MSTSAGGLIEWVFEMGGRWCDGVCGKLSGADHMVVHDLRFLRLLCRLLVFFGRSIGACGLDGQLYRIGSCEPQRLGDSGLSSAYCKRRDKQCIYYDDTPASYGKALSSNP